MVAQQFRVVRISMLALSICLVGQVVKGLEMQTAAGPTIISYPRHQQKKKHFVMHKVIGLNGILS